MSHMLYYICINIYVILSMYPFEDTEFSPTQEVLSHFLGIQCTITPSLCNSALSTLFGPTTNLNSSRYCNK